MAGIGGVDPGDLPFDGGSGSSVPLGPGQIVRGTLEAGKDGPVLRIGDTIVPLVGDPLADFAAGQRVVAEIVRAAPRMEARLLPVRAEPTPPGPAGSALGAVSPALLALLDSLGQAAAAPEAARVLPPAILPAQAAVRLVLALFLTPATTGEDLRTLARLVGEAAATDALPSEEAESFALLVRQWLPPAEAWRAAADPERTPGAWEAAIRRALTSAAAMSPKGATAPDSAVLDALAGFIGRFLAAEPRFLDRPALADPGALAAALRVFLARQAEAAPTSVPACPVRDPDALDALVRHVVGALDPPPARVVESAAERAARSIEARLGEALASGRVEAALAEIDQELQAWVGRLRGSGPFVAFLQRTAQQDVFDQAAQRVLDRQAGGQLQNLRGQESPYLFFEVPFPPDAPIRQAHIHLLTDGRGRARADDPRNAVVAIDLATTRLGELWISMAIYQGVCRCQIRARTPEIAATIAAHAPALAERLAAAGFPGAQVSASLWDGNRLAEAGRLVAQMAGVDVRA